MPDYICNRMNVDCENMDLQSGLCKREPTKCGYMTKLDSNSEYEQTDIMTMRYRVQVLKNLSTIVKQQELILERLLAIARRQK